MLSWIEYKRSKPAKGRKFDEIFAVASKPQTILGCTQSNGFVSLLVFGIIVLLSFRNGPLC
jgi:hypothetical protein